MATIILLLAIASPGHSQDPAAERLFDESRRLEQAGDQEAALDELELLIQNLDVSKAIFRSNHASNYLPLGGRLPAEKESLLAAVAAAKRGEVGLKPEWLRGL